MDRTTIDQNSARSIDAESIWLLVVTDSSSNHLRLDRGSTRVLGRGTEADICVEDPALSRAHLKISIDELGDIHVQDLESRNGTYVLGRRLEPREQLRLLGREFVSLGDTKCYFVKQRADSSAMVTSEEYVSQSPAMKEPLHMARRAAPFNVPVLITGEMGTGKEVMARYIHGRSSVRDGPCVAVNCAAIPSGLAESELFGTEPGAYAGADRSRAGLIEQAHGGSLFLDEIGELPLEVQAKLLRVLQDGRVRRLGASTERQVSFRLLAATNRDLYVLAARQRFREDLLFRLNLVEIELPALRDRPEDVEPLAHLLLADFVTEEGLDDRLRFSEEASSALRAHDWPGNVRELRNAVRLGAMMAHGFTIEEGDLKLQRRAWSSTNPGPSEPNDVASRPQGEGTRLTLPEELSALERRRVYRAIVSNLGNVTRAANELGVPRQRLHDLLKKHDVDVEGIRRGSVSAEPDE